MQYYFSFNCQPCKLSYVSSWVPSVPHITNRTKVSPGQMCLVPLGEFPKCQLWGRKMSLVATPGLQGYGRHAPLDPLPGLMRAGKKTSKLCIVHLIFSTSAFYFENKRTLCHANCKLEFLKFFSLISICSRSSPVSHKSKKEVTLLSSPWPFISLPFHCPFWDTDLGIKGRS